MNYENRKAAGIKASPSMAIAMAAKALRAQGRDIIDLSLGEPDFEPPQHVGEAASAAVREGRIRYGASAGTEAIRKAIADKFKRDNNLVYGLDEITVANGAKQILFDAFLATLEPGDEVIIPAPCWVSYGDIVALNGGKPVYIQCGSEAGFKITPEVLSGALTSRTRWVMFNSPSNPTGAIYSREEYQALGDVLVDHPNVLVLSDEIYEHIILGEQPFVSFGEACPELRDRTLIVNGVSKAYAMTGWRVGYAAGPKGLISSLNKMQSQTVTSVCGVAQAAAVAALNGDQSFVDAAAAKFKHRAQIVTRGLANIPELEFVAPAGAFYAFIGVSKLIGRRTPAGDLLNTDSAVAGYLLESFGLSSVPGEAFASPGFIRLSIAASDEELIGACDRLAKMVASLV
ncbi:pyridoxal phosphate-dependent aminotransferase [Pseudomonas alloputida]|uniref:pyridoxal phosphate-dependent aminotransferase n=1 Tax=Pseudomonas TaxID=286 RepID=UPI000EB2C328|nr:pyridoxal phosphate-dependent aminotransferase [Pseudomonas inefficax]WNN41321.1 pyridoxal phosphate-dependent aminotransferase [Pseudomonas inefficax]